MKKTIIYCPDIECDSCVKVISKTLNDLKGIDKFNVNKNAIEVNYDESLIKDNEIAKLISSRGYRTAFEPFTRKTFSERFRDFRENKRKYENEYKMFYYGIYSFIILIIIQLSYYFIFSRNNQLIIKNIPWLIYIDISIVSLLAAIYHFKSYRSSNVSGMLGMMIGMTFGMQSGMMIGTIIGATNGMFSGTMIGMFIGVILGFYTGKCCGIMGALQGAMSGLMGGTMGGMLGVMLYVDHILWFMPFFTLFNVLIMWGLSYLIYEDLVEDNEKTKKHQMEFWKLFLSCIIFSTMLILFIIYGLRTGVAGAL